MTDWRRACQWGLLPLAGLWVWGTSTNISGVENDLSARSMAALGGAILDKPAVPVFGRDASISGAAFAADGSKAAYDAVLGVAGIRLVDAAGVGKLTEAKPYVWSATREGAKIALGDGVPDPKMRAAINDAAKQVKGADVADGMTYSGGETAALAAGSAFALEQLGHLAKGKASLQDGALTISGVAPDSASFEAAARALAKPPAGVTIAKADITPPGVAPYVFSAANIGDTLTLTGSAPSLEARDAIAAAAKAAFPKAKIDNQLTFASGAPKGDGIGAVKFALAAIAGLDGGKATLTDAALSVSGKARALGDFEATQALLAAPPAGFTLAGADITPLAVKPYVLGAEHTASGFTLTGLAPDMATRGKIEDAAKGFDLGAVDDKIQIAAGAPQGDEAAAMVVALAAAGGLEGGKASLSDGALTVSGKATKLGQLEALDDLLSNLPAGVTLAKVDVAAPVVSPYALTVERAAAGVALRGLAPDAATRSKLDEAARALNAGPVTDHIEIAAGVPKGLDFTAAALFAIRQLASVKSGVASLSDMTLSLKADAPDAATKDALDAALKAAPGGLAAGEVAINAPPPPAPEPAKPASADDVADRVAAMPVGEPVDTSACNANFRDILGVAHIEFDSGKASISQTSSGVLEQVATMARRCQTGKMEVSGHTDSTGDAAGNLALSKQRAEAVVAFLKRAGVPEGRMTAVGFGATKPIASNDTDAGKAQNRRIEISVTE